MHLLSIDLRNYRSFERAKIQLSPKINLFVGQNNVGKSAILQAAYLLQQNQTILDAVRHGNEVAYVRVMVAGISESLLSKEQISNLAGRKLPSECTYAITLNRNQGREDWWEVAKNDRHRATTFEAIQPRNLLCCYFSQRRTTSYSENATAQFANDTTGTHHHLYAKVDKVVSSPQLRGPFESACRDVIGFVPGTFYTQGGKRAGLEVDAQQQRHISMAEMGAGVSNAVGIIVDLITSTNKCFLVEELENDLHPTALRALLKLIVQSASNGSQFLISTHSNIVIRSLGATPETKTFEVRQLESGPPPKSTIREVSQAPTERLRILRDLGYELADLELYNAFLIFEESSAERIVRDFLIPWFVGGLQGKLKTIAGSGVDDVRARFSDLQRVMVYTHLQPVYANKTWAIVDAGAAGEGMLNKLRDKFPSLPADRLQALKHTDFERYYPSHFAQEVDKVLAHRDAGAKKQAKKELLLEVIDWLTKDPGAKSALEESCEEVIALLKNIDAVVNVN